MDGRFELGAMFNGIPNAWLSDAMSRHLFSEFVAAVRSTRGSVMQKA